MEGYGLLLTRREDEKVIPFCDVFLGEGDGGPVLNLAEDLAEKYVVSCHCFDCLEWGAIGRDDSPGEILGENGYQVLPTEGAKTSFFHIPVAGAAPVLRAFATSVDVLAAESRIEATEGFTDLLGLARLRHFEVDEVATGGGTHLSLGFLDEQSLGGSHQGGAGLDGDGFDVASNESVVGGGGDDGGFHSKLALSVKHSISLHSSDQRPRSSQPGWSKG